MASPISRLPLLSSQASFAASKSISNASFRSCSTTSPATKFHALCPTNSSPQYNAYHESDSGRSPSDTFDVMDGIFSCFGGLYCSGRGEHMRRWQQTRGVRSVGVPTTSSDGFQTVLEDVAEDAEHNEDPIAPRPSRPFVSDFLLSRSSPRLSASSLGDMTTAVAEIIEHGGDSDEGDWPEVVTPRPASRVQHGTGSRPLESFTRSSQDLAQLEQLRSSQASSGVADADPAKLEEALTHLRQAFYESTYQHSEDGGGWEALSSRNPTDVAARDDRWPIMEANDEEEYGSDTATPIHPFTPPATPSPLYSAGVFRTGLRIHSQPALHPSHQLRPQEDAKVTHLGFQRPKSRLVSSKRQEVIDLTREVDGQDDARLENVDSASHHRHQSGSGITNPALHSPSGIGRTSVVPDHTLCLPIPAASSAFDRGLVTVDSPIRPEVPWAARKYVPHDDMHPPARPPRGKSAPVLLAHGEQPTPSGTDVSRSLTRIGFSKHKHPSPRRHTPQAPPDASCVHRADPRRVPPKVTYAVRKPSRLAQHPSETAAPCTTTQLQAPKAAMMNVAGSGAPSASGARTSEKAGLPSPRRNPSKTGRSRPRLEQAHALPVNCDASTSPDPDQLRSALLGALGGLRQLGKMYDDREQRCAAERMRLVQEREIMALSQPWRR